jgi:hypothetical protein
VSAAATITVFADNKGHRVHVVRPMSLIEVECLIRAVEPAAAKDKLPLLKLATFGDNKTDAACLRFDANVTQVSGIEGDYDGEKMTMEEGAEKLRAAGIEALLYTSASHRPDKPRWRVLCRLATPLTGTETELRGQRKRLVGVLNAILGGVLKGESFALSQSFYFGRVNGRPDPVIRRTTGICIDEIDSPPAPVYPISDATKAREKDTSDSAKLFAKVANLLRKGKDEEDIIAALATTDRHASKQPDPRRAVQRCIENVRKDEDEWRQAVLDEMNAANAVINWKGKTLILRESRDPSNQRPIIDLSTIGDMRNWLANRPGYFDNWFKHEDRRQFKSVVFEPQREVPGHFNLWRGWGVDPKAGDCSLWLVMVHEVICSGNEDHYKYVLEWCADAIQNPTERPGVVLVLRGLQGTGKGTFARVLGKLFGDHFLHIRYAKHLTGNFNAHLSNVLLLFADEAYFPGDRSGEGALKALITEPTIPLEYKGKDVISVNNYIRVVMASNNDWVVPAAMDDRRFAVLDISREHAQDTDYFGAIFRQLDTGGYEALLQFLLEYPMGDVDLRKIPDTEARREQQAMSLDPFLAFWLQWLQEPVRDDDSNFHMTAELYDGYRKSTSHAMSAVGFAMRLCKLFPAARRERQQTKEKSYAGRAWGYAMPPLAEMRKNFDDAVGRPTVWQDETAPVSQLSQLDHPSGDLPEREP